jgi:predicted DNA-binding transcriptional regulator AlpA
MVRLATKSAQYDALAWSKRMSSALDSLPAEIGRHRILDTAETCQFVSVSVAQWRRMRSLGETPAAIMIGSKKMGWRVGDLVDWIASRSQAKAAA